ncbi:MAG: hypothetical protein QOC70_1211, partial [Verrucomicrobiota bacterium]
MALSMDYRGKISFFVEISSSISALLLPQSEIRDPKLHWAHQDSNLG